MVVDDLACVIYADAEGGQLSEQMRQRAAGGPINRANGNDVDILRNLDFDATRRGEFPDGFLFFESRIEIHPDATPAESLDDQVRLVSAVLERLWSQGVPAVASCDYEDRLPQSGGYRSTTIPWPTRPEH